MAITATRTGLGHGAAQVGKHRYKLVELHRPCAAVSRARHGEGGVRCQRADRRRTASRDGQQQDEPRDGPELS